MDRIYTYKFLNINYVFFAGREKGQFIRDITSAITFNTTEVATQIPTGTTTPTPTGTATAPTPTGVTVADVQGIMEAIQESHHQIMTLLHQLFQYQRSSSCACYQQPTSQITSLSTLDNNELTKQHQSLKAQAINLNDLIHRGVKTKVCDYSG